MAATSFPLFMYLPFELRARVWELTAEPRTVDVDWLARVTTRTDYEADDYRVFEINVDSLTPIPAIVQVCREARQLGVYRQLFSELEDVRDGGERRYVWLNLELDLVDVGRTPLDSFIPVAASIKRLKFMRHSVNIEDMICLGQCVNLKELHIDVSGSLSLNFYELFKRLPLHCGMENIFMVDALLGRVPLRMADISDYGRANTEWLLSTLETTLRTRGIQWGL
ncbi:hypothetical protein B0H65DRAFT_582472 [Neurospora tetraspora]|uniref:2EXR domain-containing protein n=1 Tax=Neurospora tetraspora TaxID=94610 RepID=A0AAE0J8E3_9PEZI|nr:hypothetical protein B0H65DRAFT_582472 [Neurospora tetraspora]